MIGDKDIEEAARLDDKEYYDRLSDNDRCFFEYGFRRGYNRALKDLWHPVSEKPKKERVFLYKTVFKGYGLNQIVDRKEWEYIIKYQKATQWLYIDDLLPKKGGEK